MHFQEWIGEFHFRNHFCSKEERLSHKNIELILKTLTSFHNIHSTMVSHPQH